MSEETPLGDAVAASQSIESAAAPAAPKKRGRPRKTPSPDAPATESASDSAADAPAITDSAPALAPRASASKSKSSAAPAPAAVAPLETPLFAAPASIPAAAGIPAAVPAFSAVSAAPETPASGGGRTGDAVVFDPRKIIEQFRATAATSTPPSPSTPAFSAAPAATHSAPDSERAPAAAPFAAPASEFAPRPPRADSPPPANATSSHTAAAAADDDRATAEDLAQFSGGDSFTFTPDAPEPAPARDPAASTNTATSTAPASAPNRPQSPNTDPHQPRANAHAPNAQPNRGWQQQPPRQNSGNPPPQQQQQQGKNRPQPPPQQPQPKHGKNPQHPKQNKPQPGRQWGNVTLDESVDERAIALGVAFDYETLNTPDGLAPLAAAAAQPGEPLDLDALHTLPVNDLLALARTLGCDWKRIPARRQLITQILAAAPAAARPIHVTGTLEILENGNGLLLYLPDDYRVRELSAFVPRQLIRQHGLQRGHEITALAAPPRDGETAPIIVRVDKVMGETPDTVATWLPFTELTPYYPTQRIFLETDPATATWDNLSMRCVDLLCPIGLGQRGLIVAPPRTGKTILLQGIANAVLKNTPQAHLIVLLVDERPEEVTDFKRQVKQAEVVSSTFDENAESHVHAAEIVIERARRMVEAGRHVIILLDSITRLARAYNALQPSGGKILSGGVESNALAKPKRFFGSARNIEGAGSLTILGTALVETGSKMDEVIFEEFKGTGNMELDLDRDLANKRIFPAISFERSGTRKEELLYHPDELQKIYALRRAMKGVPSADAMEQLIQRIKKTKTNVEFLLTLGR